MGDAPLLPRTTSFTGATRSHGASSGDRARVAAAVRRLAGRARVGRRTAWSAAACDSAASGMSSKPVIAKSRARPRPARLQAQHQAEGDVVVVADRGGEHRIALEQRARFCAAASARVGAHSTSQCASGVMPAADIAAHVALAALPARTGIAMSAEEGDAPMAERQQMFGRQARAAFDCRARGNPSRRPRVDD